MEKTLADIASAGKRRSFKTPFGLALVFLSLTAAGADFPIADFGATADGTMCTAAIARAVDACAAAGGGRVVVPRGEWRTGPVALKSRVELHLARGATLLFSGATNDYPLVLSSFEGTEMRGPMPLVYAYGATNVAVSGAGELRAETEIWRGVRHRPPFLQFNRCAGVRLEGFRIRRPPFWTIHLLCSSDVRVSRLDVDAFDERGMSLGNTDGIDIESSRDVVVEDCSFRQNDDAIVVKSGRNECGRRRGMPSENVVVRRCAVAEGHALLAIGSELSGGIRSVTMEDCTVTGAVNRLVYVKTNRERGGFVEKVAVRRIRADRVRRELLAVVSSYGNPKGPTPQQPEGVPLTRISGLSLEDVECNEAGDAVHIEGDPLCPVEDVRTDGIRVRKLAGRRFLPAHW